MDKRKTLFIIALFFILALPRDVFSEVVHLKNGGKIEGEIISETADRIKIRTRISIFTVEKTDIFKVEGPARVVGEGYSSAVDLDSITGAASGAPEVISGDTVLEREYDSSAYKPAGRNSYRSPYEETHQSRYRLPEESSYSSGSGGISRAKSALKSTIDSLQGEYNDMMNRQSELERELRGVRSSIPNKINQAKAALEATISSLENERQSLISRQKMLEEQLALVPQRIEQAKIPLEADIQTLKRERNMLLTRQSELSSELARLPNKLEEAQAPLEAKIRSLEEERDSLIRRKSELASELDSLLVKKRQLETERDNLISRKNSLQDELEEVRLSVADEIEKAKAPLEKTMGFIREERDTLIVRNRELENTNSSMLAENSGLKETNSMLLTSNSELEKRYNGLLAKTNDIESERAALLSEKVNIEKTLEEVKLDADRESRREIASLENELEDLKSERNGLLYEKNRLMAQLDSQDEAMQRKIDTSVFELKAKLDALRDERGDLLVTNKDLRQERDLLFAEKRDLRGQIDAARIASASMNERANTKLELKLADLGEEKTRLENERDALRQAVNAAEKKAETNWSAKRLEGRIKDLEDEKGRLYDKNVQLRAQVNRLKREARMNLAGKTGSSGAEGASLNKVIDSIEKDRRSLLERQSLLEDELNQARSNIASLTRELASTEMELKDVRGRMQFADRPLSGDVDRAREKELEKRIKQLEEERNQMISRRSRSKEISRSFDEEKSELLGRHRDLEEQLMIARGDVAKLGSKLAATEAKLDSVTEELEIAMESGGKAVLALEDIDTYTRTSKVREKNFGELMASSTAKKADGLSDIGPVSDGGDLRSGFQNARIYYKRASSYFERGLYEKSIPDFSNAIDEDPSFLDAYNDRALAYLYVGEYDKSLTDLNKVIDSRPGFATAHYNRGNAYFNKGDFSKALSDFNRAIEIEPGYAKAYYARALLHKSSNRAAKAIEDLTKTINIDPDNTDARYERGGAYYSEGRYRNAIADYKKVLNINSDDADAYYGLAVACEKIGDCERAIKAYDNFIKYAPPEYDSYVSRARSKLQSLKD